jgi:hypothetical protein
VMQPKCGEMSRIVALSLACERSGVEWTTEVISSLY